MNIFLNGKEIKLTFLLDDTIDIIRLKIEEQLEIDYEDIYLYIKKYKKFTPILFDQLRKNNNDILFKDIYPFLSNIDIEFDEIDYKYEDFLSLHLNKPHLVNIPLTHNYKTFIVDPHHKYAKSLIIKDPPIITNQNILLDFLPFEELHIITRNKIPYDIRSYYFVSDKPDIKVPNIDYLFDEPKETFKQYITSISCQINSMCTFIPIEIIFKNLHAKPNIPFIIYNPGPLREKIFRLYGTELSSQHTIIPILSKSDINNYYKDLAKSTMISIVIKEDYEMILNLLDDGNITFTIKNIMIDNFKNIETKLKDIINPIIYDINSIISTNGYIYPTIDNIEDLQCLGLSYNAVLKTKQNIIPHLKCMSSIFYFGDNEFLYKRISNFNIKGSIQKFISKYYGVNEQRIIDLLVSEKNLSEVDAKNELNIFKIQRKLEEGLFKMILNQQPNPGFLVELNEDQDENIVITINDINNFEYLNIIPVYINGLYLMILDKMNKHDKEMLCEYKQETVKQLKTSYDNTTKKLLELDFSDNELKFDLGDSDDSDNSDDSDDSDDLDIEFDDFYDGGNVRNKNASGDSYSSYAQDRLMKRDPELFLKQKQGNYLAYSRFCQSTKDRQPMVLTKDEMEDIKKKYPKTDFGNVLNYGTDNDHKHSYMCPKYWCKKKGEERPLTQQDIDEGKHGCGEIIPRDENGNLLDPKPNQMILTFVNNHYNDKGEYVQNHPGLSKSHPNEKLCVPCCFKKPMDSKQSKENLDKCMNSNTEKEQVKKQYVVNYDKIPDKDRIGYLPLPLQKLFNIEGKLVDFDNTYNLVTYGVDKTDSFISTLTFYYNTLTYQNITNKDMRKLIYNQINLETMSKTLTLNNQIIEMFNY
jgi:hypothetical protein